MIERLAVAYLLGLLPGFEGRYVVASAPLLGLTVTQAYLIACLSTTTLAALIPILVDTLEWLVARTRLSRLYNAYVHSARRRLERLVEKAGFIGLIIFVATPLPATGQWTGGVAARLLGMPRQRVTLALLIGGLAANTLVYAAAVTASNAITP